MKLSNVLTLMMLASSGVAVGCAEPVLEDDVPIVTGLDDGYLTVAWTIDGGGAAQQCTDNDITGFHIDIYDEDGYWVLDRLVPCDLFKMGIRLVEGSYYAEASLLALDGLVVTQQRYERGLHRPAEPGGDDRYRLLAGRHDRRDDRHDRRDDRHDRRVLALTAGGRRSRPARTPVERDRVV